MSLKENNPETASENTLDTEVDTSQDYPESDGSGESGEFAASTETQMESGKNTKVNVGENSTKKSNTESKETKGKVSKSESKKGRAKDASPSVREEAGVLIEGFCGFENDDAPKLFRSTREASRNATAKLTRKSTSKLEKSERKSDSPPDLVLFLKEGRGRAQTYSDPPRLDPESIATRRRTRVPDDPVALISKAKMSAEKTKKEQKESAKKERKNKVMETPESLKRLVKERSRLVQACSSKDSSDSGAEEKTPHRTYSKGKSRLFQASSKDSSDSNTEEKTQLKTYSKKYNRIIQASSKDSSDSSTEEKKTQVKTYSKGYNRIVQASSSKDSSDSNTEEKTRVKTYSKGASESEKVRSSGSSTGSEEEPPASLSRQSSRGRRDSDDEPDIDETEEAERAVSSDSSDDLPDLKQSTSYSNLGTILNKMSRNNADRRIPVVIMSKSEKKVKIDLAKPKSRKKGASDVSLSSAVLKIASTASPALAAETSDSDEESLSGEEGSSRIRVSEPEQNETQPSAGSDSDSEASQDVIVVKVNSDVKTDGKNTVKINSDMKTEGKNTAKTKDKVVNIMCDEAEQMRQDTQGPNTKAQAKTDSVQSDMKETVSGPQPSVFRALQGSSSPVKFSSVSSPTIKPYLVPSSTRPSLVISSVRPNPCHPHIRPKPITSTIKPSLVPSHDKPKHITSFIKTIPSPIKPKPVTSPIKPKPVTSPTMSSPATTPIKSNIVTSPLKSGSVMSHFKYGSLPSPIKPGCVTSPNPQSEKSPPFVVSMSQIVGYGAARGSIKTAKYTPGLKASKGTASMHTLRAIAPKQESSTNTSKTDTGVRVDKTQGSSSHQASTSSSQKAPILDYTDIETQEVVLGENEDSNGHGDSVGAMPAEPELQALEESVSSSEEDAVKVPEQSSPAKESLSPEGRVALDHSYSSGGSSSRKKSPNTYEKSLTPRPVYSNASTAKRSLDIMLHNDKINILRQMSQIFNDEKPPQQMFSEEKGDPPEPDVTASSSDGEEGGADEGVRKTKESTPHQYSNKTSKDKTVDSSIKGASKTVDSSLKGTSKNVDSSLKGTSKTVDSSIKDTSKTVDSSLKGTSKNVDSSLKGTSKNVDSSIKDTRKTVDSSLKDTSKTVDSSLKGTSKTVDSSLKGTSKNVDSSLKGTSKNVDSSIKDTSKTVDSSIKGASKTVDSSLKDTSGGETSKAKTVEENDDTLLSECTPRESPATTPSRPSAVEAEPKAAPDTPTAADTSTSSEGTSSSINPENNLGIECTPPAKGRRGENPSDDAYQGGLESPFLGFPDTDPKVHHVPAYSPALNEKIQVQNKIGPAGETIDVVDGFSFTSFNSEVEMMSYDGAYGGTSTRIHRQWLKKKRRKRRRRIFRYKGMWRPRIPMPLEDEELPTHTVIKLPTHMMIRAVSPKDRGATADYGAFASDDLDTYLDNNSRLNISYPIPKYKVTEEGVSKIEEKNETTAQVPPQTQTHPPPPQSPQSSLPPPSPSPSRLPREELMPSETQAMAGVNPNTSAMEQHTATGATTDSVDHYEEVNAIDILYPKEKYKYYYNKELCKETQADGSDVFVQRAGKLVPLTTVLKSQKFLEPESSSRKSVELVYVYDGGKLLTLGGSLTKINPSNSDSVRARVVLPIGVPPIPKGETVTYSTKKVQAVEINEDLAKFALSALQSSHLKTEEEAVDKKDDCKESSPVPGTSSSAFKDEDMEVAMPEATPSEKTETAAKAPKSVAPKAAPFSMPIKPTKRNILDIIAAKLAMSDEESDEKEEAEVKEVATKPETKEDGDTVKENNDMEIEPARTVTSEKSKDSVVKQEDAMEEGLEDKAVTKTQTVEKGEGVEPKSEVKQEGEAQDVILLSDTVDDTLTKGDKQTSKVKTVDLVNLDREEEGEDRSEPLIVKESGEISLLEQSAETYTVCDDDVLEAKTSSKESVLPKEEKKDGKDLRVEGKDSVNEVDSEKKDEESEPVVSLDKEKKTEDISSEEKEHVSEVSDTEDEESNDITMEDEEEEKKGSKSMAQEKIKGNLEENDNKSDVEVLENKDLSEKAASPEVKSKEEVITLGKEESSIKSPAVSLKEKDVRQTKERADKDNTKADKGADTEKQDSTINETEAEAETTSTTSTGASTSKTSASKPSETCKAEVQGSTSGEGSSSQPESASSVPDAEIEKDDPEKTWPSPSSQESGERMHTQEKEKSPEFGTPDTIRMEIKSRVFKRNMARFPSLSREMKRLNMNFVSYHPPAHQEESEKEQDVTSEIKEDCSNDHCMLGCLCESLSCLRKSVEHCGRLECMFECTCRDESWKLPSGSGKTMNAVSIFNLDREQKEGLALREKDFKRTVIQTGSEVILVGAERKKREIRLPGRYREVNIWKSHTNVTTDEEHYFQPQDFYLEPNYPGIPLSEASKYIKKFSLNIPWYDIKGISVWCMNHSCYDCRCLTDATFNDPIKVESKVELKEESAEVKPESILESILLPVPLEEPPKPKSASSALVDFEDALQLKKDFDPVPRPVKDGNVVDIVLPDATCSIMNIIVNNSETRRKYTWKLKEWTHEMEFFCARTAGYTKKKMTEETKDILLSGQATPQQVVESVVRTLRKDKASDEVKMPALPCSKNFEPFMDDSLTTLQNAIGFHPETTKKHTTMAETPCPLVDLTNGVEEISAIPKHLMKSKKSRPFTFTNSPVGRGPKVNRKRKVSDGSVEAPAKRAHFTKPEEGASVVPAGSSGGRKSGKSRKSSAKEMAALSEQGLSKKTLSLLEMMVAEEHRGELELDLSNNVAGNALLVAEARFRKLINMNIIGVIGINKAGRCIIGTVDSDEALQVMHQIQNMIRNNTLDVGPNMREIFFPPPYVGIRPRYVMIRCDSHRKWEIVGVVQKKGPIRAPSKGSEHKAKASSKSQVPQIIDLEEEEDRQKQLSELKDIKVEEHIDLIKQEEQYDVIEPHSPGDSGAWEGSLPLIASVHSASDSNMAELIGFPDLSQEGSEEPQVTQIPLASTSYEPSVTKKTMPDLVRLDSSSVDVASHTEEQAESLSVDAQPTETENMSQQKIYFVPTAINVSSGSTKPAPGTSTDAPIKSITLNVASNRAFGKYSERPPVSPKPFTFGNVSYVMPKLPGSGNSDTSTVSLKQIDNKDPVDLTEERCDTDSPQALTPASPSSKKMLYIPVTSAGGVSKVLLVPSVSGGASPRMMLLPSLPGTSATESATTTTTTTLTTLTTASTSTTTTPTPISATAATITTGKMKMVLVPSPLDSNKMLLIPAPADSNDGATASSASGNPPADKERKKMLVLPPSIINNFMARTSSSEPASTQPHQQTCKGMLLVPLPNTGDPPNTALPNETEKDNEAQPEDSHSQDGSDIVVIGTASGSPAITSFESCAERDEIPPSLVSSAPIASTSGVAETNVVSSLTTISSTMQEKTSLPEVEKELNSAIESPVQEYQPDTIFDKTHEEMLSGTKSAECVVLESAEEEVSASKKDSQKVSTKVIVRSQKSNIVQDLPEIQDPRKQVLIKKGGFHWSAVDLSLNFKSVKLEWLLGTIRKSVLMNIYQMSKKTHSPVTLSVKNGPSTSMLYGFARACKSTTLPILILGSVVSAVLSSNSVPYCLLFQINSIKYFIRENTGELSSYTYASETHLVKLASKKRGNAGEMLGIGERIEIYKMRDVIFLTHSQKAAVEADKILGTGYTKHAPQAKPDCSCKDAGYVRCVGYCASTSSASSSKLGRTEGTPAGYPSEDGSPRTSLDNDSLPGALGFQDIAATSTHTQERDKAQGNSKLPTTSKKCHSGLPRILTKSSRDKLSMRKAMQRKNTKAALASAIPDHHSSVAKQSIPLRLDKIKTEEESNTTYYSATLNPSNLVGSEGSVVPKIECESEEEEEGDEVDVMGDEAASQDILTDLRQQFEVEKTEVHKIVSAYTSKDNKKKGSTAQGGPPAKRLKTGLPGSDAGPSVPHSRRGSGAGKVKSFDPFKVGETSGKEEPQDSKDSASKFPSHLSHLRPSASGGQSPNLLEETDPDSYILSKEKIYKINAKQALLSRIQLHKEKLLLEGECQNDERNSELHNKLERMRRRVMRHLFTHLQRVIVKVPRNALITPNGSHAKKAVLCAGHKATMILKNEELRLTMEEEKIRSERSTLIKHLASIIGDSTEEIKVKWRNWVRDHMQNPTARQTFESSWQPFRLEEDILVNALQGNTFDMDLDEGSPLPEGSPVAGPSSSPLHLIHPIPVQRPTLKRVFVKRKLSKKGKKLGRPAKVGVHSGQRDARERTSSAETVPVPTSILLMAGTSSRGRKIVRKEDINFIT